ncbi:MAG: hypothetical protein GXX83_00940 [Gaiellales bacterium]|nr:hypothetical protein [Gaiellales bacterium]
MAFDAGQNLYVSITGGAVGGVGALLLSPEATDMYGAREKGWWVASTAVTGDLCGFGTSSDIRLLLPVPVGRRCSHRLYLRVRDHASRRR